MKILVKLVLIVFLINSFQFVFASTSWNWIYKKVYNKSEKFTKKSNNNLNSSLNWQKQVKDWKTKNEIIMKFWKQKKQKLVNDIYEQTNIASLMDLNNAAKQLSDISSRLENVNISYKTIEKQKKGSDKKYKIVLENVKTIIIWLNNKNKQLKTELLSIQILSRELKNMKNQIKNIDDTIYISKEQVEKYIWLLYKINNDYYNSLAGLDEIKLLFKSQNIAHTLSKENIIKMLSLKTQDLLWNLKKSKSIKSKFLKKMYSKRIDYINTVNEYKTEIEVLNSKRNFLVDLLTMLRKNKQDIDAIYDKLHRKKSILTKQQVQLTNSIMWTWQALTWDVKIKKIDLSAILKYTTKTDWDKFLSWPVTLYPKLNATFHDPEYFKNFGWEHDGIDIKVPQLSEVYSAAAWYVYYVSDNNSDYYNYIVIVHNYWYISIYWHVYKSFVKPWDVVQRWQLIAASWWTKGTRWSWKFSTWPHLHFEVYKNWQHIDPLSALDLSVYKKKSEVPKKWQLKYIKDSLTRKISLDWLRYLPLSLIHKQRQNLIVRSAAAWFNNLTWWIQPAKKFGIDPDLAICIWYAESSLWYHTSSKNNIWNVWNNDRWDRVDDRTPQYGINAIYYTLNNKFLSKYPTIDKLSRWWNKDSKIYSSSSYNWQKNIIRCLSVLKWHPIDEYFPFRTISISEKNQLLKLSVKK